MRTDGPHYAAGAAGGGGVYVPSGSTRTLFYSGDVARSYESGAIRGFIDAGELTVAWEIGTEFADAFSHTERFQSAIVANGTEALAWVAPHALEVLSIKAYAATVATVGAYTLAVSGDGNNLLVGATFDLTSMSDATVEELSLTATAADLTLAEDDVVLLSIVSDNAGLDAANMVVVIEYAHR